MKRILKRTVLSALAALLLLASCAGGGNGFTFAAYSAYEMLCSAERAAGLYRTERETFEKLRKKVMGVDFGWKKSAREYEALYDGLLK